MTAIAAAGFAVSPIRPSESARLSSRSSGAVLDEVVVGAMSNEDDQRPHPHDRLVRDTLATPENAVAGTDRRRPEIVLAEKLRQLRKRAAGRPGLAIAVQMSTPRAMLIEA